MVRLSFNDFLLKASQEKRDRPHLRMGQCYYNTFADIDPDHASFLSGLPTIDCYHSDDNIGNFLYEVSITWNLRASHHKR